MMPRLQPVVELPLSSSGATSLEGATCSDGASSSAPATSKLGSRLSLCRSDSDFRDSEVGLELDDSEVAGKVSSASYRIVSLDFLSFLFSLICCETCGHGLDVTEDRRMGLATTFSFSCGSCGDNVSKSTSYAANVGKSHEINNRFVYACKAAGFAYEKICTFFAGMDLPKPIVHSRFNEKLDQLASACKSAFDEHKARVRDLVRAECMKSPNVDASLDTLDIAVSYDGTWQKRGHTSHHDLGAAIDLVTGFVVDFEVMSNFCVACERGPKAGDPKYEEF